MGNCLVTKLKGTVDNDSLIKLNELVVKVNAGDTSLNIYFSPAYGTTARIISGTGYLSDSTSQNYDKTHTYPSGTSNALRVVATTECEVALNIKDVSPVGFISDQNYPTIDLSYIGERIMDLFGVNITGNLSAARVSRAFGTTTQIVNISNATDVLGFLTRSFDADITSNREICIGSGANVDLSIFEGRSNLNVRLFNGCYGQFDYLGDTRTNDLWIPPTDRAGISGSVEGYVQRAIASGRTTGSMKFGWAKQGNASITYQGIRLQDNTNIPNIENTIFSWDAQGNISWS